MDELLHHRSTWVLGAALGLLILVYLFRRPAQAASDAGTVYAPGFTSQEATEIIGMQLSAAAQSEATAAGEKVALANIGALKSVNLSEISTAGDVANAQIAAGTSQATIYADMNKAIAETNLEAVNNTNASNVQIAKVESATQENLLNQQTGRTGALADLLNMSSFKSQLGSAGFSYGPLSFGVG